MGLEKTSANEELFVDAQIRFGIHLQHTTQIIPGTSFITAHVAYASTNKTKLVWIETKLFSSFFFYPGRTRLKFTCVLRRHVASTVLLVSKPFGGRWQFRGSWSALQWRIQLCQSEEKEAEKRCSECGDTHSEHRFPAPSSRLCQN